MDPAENDGTWSDHPLWAVLRKTRLRLAQAGRVRAEIAPEVLALAGRTMSISGFAKPLGFMALGPGGGEYGQFVLSRYSPECPFCPAAGPTESLEVTCRAPVPHTPAMVTVTGIFSVQDRMERGAFYRLSDAVLAS